MKFLIKPRKKFGWYDFHSEHAKWVEKKIYAILNAVREYQNAMGELPKTIRLATGELPKTIRLTKSTFDTIRNNYPESITCRKGKTKLLGMTVIIEEDINNEIV